MSDAAVALAILGFSVGMLFRLRILLSILALLLVLSIVFSVARGFSFVDAALTIMFVQSIVQGSYFLGLVARSVARRNRPVL
jgi:heme/copper-type cytochrome/quinol oxidase subunit 4